MGFLIATGSVVLTLVVVEICLRTWLPFSVATIGHLDSENAARYGWGFHPREIVRIGDPDTGALYKSLTNSRGWRDVEHSFENPDSAFRILVLGDSNTFGAIVPADRIYTRVLEDRLRAEGKYVEVISIAYGRWGTDQELEAFREEGIRYNPDLVILQISANDISDNMFHVMDEEKHIKPFYYELDDTGRLVRRVNPSWTIKDRRRIYQLKKLLRQSEILKRIHGLYIASRLGDLSFLRRLSPEADEMDFEDETSYSIHAPKIRQLLEVCDSVNPGFISFLESRLDEYIDGKALIRELERHGETGRADTVLRIFEARWFKDWSREMYYPATPDPGSYAWRLFFGLVTAIKEQADTVGADLVILSDVEEGGYQWEREWFRISPTPETKDRYLAPSRIVRAFAESSDIGFVDHREVHTRARNDMHPNIQGNKAMAENILVFLKERYWNRMGD